MWENFELVDFALQTADIVDIVSKSCSSDVNQILKLSTRSCSGGILIFTAPLHRKIDCFIGSRLEGSKLDVRNTYKNRWRAQTGVLRVVECLNVD